MLRGRHVSLGTTVWLVVGVFVAATHHFFDHLDSVDRIGSALLAVLVWPLVVLHIHIGI
jgi:hypothetical protein